MRSECEDVGPERQARAADRKCTSNLPEGEITGGLTRIGRRGEVDAVHRYINARVELLVPLTVLVK